MKIYRGLSSIDESMRGAVLSVGNFDGVHLGHQRILRTARALAHVSSASVVAMTFEPHPLQLLRPGAVPGVLTPWDEKVRQLERAGADAVVRLETDWPLLSLSAADFVHEILTKRLHPSYIVEGPNFGFGRGRKGTIETLAAMSAKGGYQLRVVDPYRITLPERGLVPVSSTLVRRCLAAGQVESAALCLGRPYALAGKVVHGSGRGRELGFPTINLEPGGQLVPAEGVYAGFAELAGIRAPAAVSIGRRPTMGGGNLVVEAFVLDESGDWYATEARLVFTHRLRAQVCFENAEALVSQIADDVSKVRALVAVP